MEFPRNMQKHCQSHHAIQNYTQSGCHQSRLLHLFSDITHMSVIVFDINPSAHPLTTSNSASSLIQLSFGMLYRLILSLLLLWISLNHRSKPTTTKQFSILYICKYVTFFFFFFFFIID
jgi:sensor c-di-GMP phosphodiesterase-like protein